MYAEQYWKSCRTQAWWIYVKSRFCFDHHRPRWQSENISSWSLPLGIFYMAFHALSEIICVRHQMQYSAAIRVQIGRIAYVREACICNDSIFSSAVVVFSRAYENTKKNASKKKWKHKKTSLYMWFYNNVWTSAHRSKALELADSAIRTLCQWAHRGCAGIGRQLHPLKAKNMIKDKII